ncbi:MAG: hypothetical protein H7A36_03270 [Chlamydiales bacterium]|nr:hypothetical protein [Chlamydiales bacterium]
MSETVLEGHISKVLCLAVTPDGKNIISGSDSEDQAVRIWDIASGQQLARLSGHTGGVSCVVVTPNGKNIISCSWDNTIRVWDIARRQQLAHLSGHTGGPACCYTQWGNHLGICRHS